MVTRKMVVRVMNKMVHYMLFICIFACLVISIGIAIIGVFFHDWQFFSKFSLPFRMGFFSVFILPIAFLLLSGILIYFNKPMASKFSMIICGAMCGYVVGITSLRYLPEYLQFSTLGLFFALLMAVAIFLTWKVKNQKE